MRARLDRRDLIIGRLQALQNLARVPAMLPRDRILGLKAVLVIMFCGGYPVIPVR